MDERIMIHDQYKAKQREILAKLEMDAVFMKKHSNLLVDEAAQALDELFLEVVGEDDGSSLAEFARNKLRYSIRAIIKGGKH